MYRSYQFTTADTVEDDPEDTKVAARSPEDKASAPDRDRSDDQTTGEPTEMGDLVEYSDSPEEFEKTAEEVAKEERERDGEGTS